MPKHDLPYAMETVKFPIKLSSMNSENGRVFGYGETVGNGIEGWAPGAIFIDTDASAGANLWRNDGTSTTATWVAVGGEQFLDNEALYFGTGTTDDAWLLFDGTRLIIESSGGVQVNIDEVGALRIDDAVIASFAAATDTAGQDVYIETQDAGATPTTAKAGGAFTYKSGDGASAANAVACGAGGGVTIGSGAGGANTGGATGQAGGAGGATVINGGTGGATNSTGAHAAGGGGAVLITGGTGAAASAGTGAGGVGGAIANSAGAGGNSTGGTGGAGGAGSLVAGAGGDSATGNAGAGADVSLTAGAGGDASAGTGNGGDGGSIVMTPGAGGSTTGGTAGAAGAVEVAGTFCKDQPTPTAKTTAVTLTAAELLTGIITATHAAGSTQAYTLPTGTQMSTALEVANDQAFDFTIINLSAALVDTVTLTANTAFTIVGQALIESAHTDSEFPSSGTFRARKTAANTWVAYRL